MLQVSFGFSAGNFGPDDDHMNPGAIAVVDKVGIARAREGVPRGLVLDAAEVNPAST
jgi:hypothetical protein